MRYFGPRENVNESSPVRLRAVDIESASMETPGGTNRGDRPIKRFANRFALAAGAMAVAVWVLMTLNAGRHDYRIGYDIAAHIAYAKTLSAGHLPSPAESHEFFTPPLAYVPAAMLFRVGFTEEAVGPIWQALQACYAAILLWYVLVSIFPGQLRAAGVFVLFTLSGAVWWRSFAMIRPEALLALLVGVGFIQTVRLFEGRREWWRFAACGLVWGAACLTRQWAILALFGVVAAALLAPRPDRRWWRGVLLSAAACAAVAAPFYLSLYVRFGSVTAFNQAPKRVTKLDWTWNPIKASGMPFMPALSGRPVDILFADTFGDYWFYYLVNGTTRSGNYLYGSRLVTALNRPPKGFVSNASAVSPTVKRSVGAGTVLVCIALVAFADALRRIGERWARRSSADPVLLLSCAIILSTLLGYAWFVRTYTGADSGTDTVKATYVLQIWPLLALLVGSSACHACRHKTRAWAVIYTLLTAAAAFTSGTWFSRFVTL